MVRVRLLSAGLSNDIRNAVKDAVRASSPDLDAHGRSMGTTISHGVATGLRNNDTDFKNAGAYIGSKFGSSAETEIRKSGTKIANSTKTVMRNASRDAVRDADETISREVRKWNFKDFGSAGSRAMGEFKKAFNLGIGAARMGPAIVSAIALAAPSAISGVAAIGTALAGQLVTTIAALGPGLTGAALGTGAAFMSLALTGGLLLAGFKALGDEGKQLSEDFSSLKTEFGKPIGRGMLQGMTDAVATLRGAIPQLNDLLTATGEAAGNAARSFAATVTSASNLSRIRSILATNVTFMQNFAEGVNGTTTAFLILGEAMKPFVDYIGQGAKAFGEWASSSLEAAKANGTLDQFVQNMLDRWKQLWGVIKDVSAGISNIFSAANPVAEQLMGRIAGIADRFRAWTETDTGQGKLLAFFQKSNEISSKIFEMLGKVARAAGNAFLNADTGPLLHVLNVLEKRVAPAFARIFGQIKAATGPILVKVFDNIASALEKMADSGAFGTIAKFMAGFLLVISNIAASDFGSTVLAWTVPLLLFGGLIEKLVSPIIGLVSALSGLSAGAFAPFLSFVGIAAAVVGVFVALYANSEKLRDSIGNLVRLLADKLMAIWDTLGPKISAVAEAFGNLAEAIGDRLAPIIDALGPTIALSMDTLGKIIGGVLDLITGLFTIFADLLTGNWGKLWDDLKDLVSTFGHDVAEIFTSVWNNLWALAIQPIIDLKDKIAEWFTGTFVPWISENWAKIPGYIALALVDVGVKLVSAFADGLLALGGWFIGTAIPWLGDRYVEVVDATVAGLKGIRDAFLTAFDDARLAVGDWFTSTFIPWIKGQWRVALTPPTDTTDAKAVTEPFDQDKLWLGEWWNTTFLPWIKDQWRLALKPPTDVGDAKAVTEPFERDKLWLGEWWNNTFVPWLTGKWTELSNTVVVGLQDVWPVVSRKFEEVRIGIGDFFTGFLGWLLGKWGEMAAQPLGVLMTMKDNVMGFFWGIGTAINEWFTGTAIPWISSNWQTIASLPGLLASMPAAALAWFSELGGKIGDWFNGLSLDASGRWSAIAALPALLSAMPAKAMQWFAEVGSGIRDWFFEHTSIISSAWVTIAGLPAVLSSMRATVIGFFQDVGAAIGGWFRDRISDITGWWNDIVALPGKILGGMGGVITGALGGVVGALLSPFTTAYNEISTVINNIKGLISGAVSAVQGAWAFITGAAGGIAAASTAAVRAADLGAAALETRGGGGSFATPAASTATSLHPLAAGGIVFPVPGGLHALIGEAGRKERVEPLSVNGLSSRDEALISHIVRTMSSQQRDTVEVQVKVDAPGMDRFITARIAQSQSDLARRIQYGRPQ